ncbi:hypothetical protein PGT21_029511 [Puccinia graminis f. sp. tritici]|uniref:Uncharacterized protein n=2 Tax=Puccinia graminis f. sp. tritici TaxID=56615 RepID=E3K4A2_PUCGT|nr:uncharacterized protein PGTG_05433 [Puccinia graminis f. sp. tritici CRL 75-36-700-3]KAA1068096.1 hypothetical protein PGTUg99_014738 [Puccinia graminis f. sp. tritici]EFP79112.2 hypothetical protein PGTG_05433 [Puccinia graminis f. sp. tritici CRL 75-36-700-3]KAA1108769.1 hypothetical protein PGT21_025041 [Puccinia graminis f. sp. tritici]KAA1109879.1 hypothetical protein PGT21_001582 [Puccinia graminis f. sp. tritici]KAA1113363.1 hypothetical protein PGT21_029511 [Puccinia graminis f. sp.
MNRQGSRRPSYQTENGYETRIRYLEEVVHLLISRNKSAPPTFISLPPVVSSFRYSKKRGLIPLLSQGTAESLTISASWTHCFNPPPHRRPPSDISARLFKPRPRSCPIVTHGASPLSVLTKDENATRDPKSTRPGILTAPPPVLNKLGSSATGPNHWSSSNTDLTCSSRPPTRASVTGLSSLRPAAGPSPVLQGNSSPARSRSLDRFPLAARAKAPKAEHASVTQSPSSVIAIVAETPASDSVPALKIAEPDTSGLGCHPEALGPITFPSNLASNGIAAPSATASLSRSTTNNPTFSLTSKPSSPHPASHSLVVLCPELSFTTEADSRPDRLSVLPPPSLPQRDTTSRPSTDPKATTPVPPPLISPTATSETDSFPALVLSETGPQTPSLVNCSSPLPRAGLLSTETLPTTPTTSRANADLKAVADSTPNPTNTSSSPSLPSSTGASPPPTSAAAPSSAAAAVAPHCSVNRTDISNAIHNTSLPSSLSLALDLSQTVLQHYEDIDNFLKLPPPEPMQEVLVQAPGKPMPEILGQGPANNTVETPRLLYSPPPVEVTLPPSFPACPVNLEVAAIGSLTVEHDNNNSMDAQLAPEYSQATLDYYNDIQEYLQQANTDETEIKKKKKKKKKKKANPTSTPDNPILFYV